MAKSRNSMASPSTGETAARICHKRGVNGDLPSQWLISIRIADLDQSLAAYAGGENSCL